MKKTPIFGVIGGSGFREMSGLKNVTAYDVKTPFGKPSGSVVIGELAGIRIAFLARHGEGHRISPSKINYRANIYALKSLGVDRIIGVSACGSLQKEIAPGDIVVPDQIFDFTKGREPSFFDEGVVVHVSTADPFCTDLSQMLFKSCKKTGAKVHKGGTFMTIEGPRFSTKAESKTFRSWGMSLVGMTTSPEAFLAREAEMCYSSLALVTDYDVWHKSEDSVSFAKIAETMKKNITVATAAIRNLSHETLKERNCDCSRALTNAIATRSEAVNKKTRDRLSLLLWKYLK